ncbi:DUF1572 family protein [Aegicerativicinus sediminis]|uniref:DUF1572 family protein n=1 Tax=Aegicerativicinus sediminis TaxID=2893202 RepID=UPI001E354F11|nr:DUF1572 family protein [Aegicerativicinus sediminis]
MEQNFLESTLKLFEYYKSLGDKTFEQLNDDELLFSPNNYSNNIAIIVRHLSGNMKSRWTNFLAEDGEKVWREREKEFSDPFACKEDILRDWENGWKCLFDALHQLTSEDINKTIFIRNQGHTVMDAILRQLAHYSSHVGQIVYLGTIIKGDKWKSLSIPKGGSNAFNEAHFSKPKETKHFTEDFIEVKKANDIE